MFDNYTSKVFILGMKLIDNTFNKDVCIKIRDILINTNNQYSASQIDMYVDTYFRRKIAVDIELIKILKTFNNDFIFKVTDEAVCVYGNMTEWEYDHIVDMLMDYSEKYNERNNLTLDDGYSVLASHNVDR